MFKIKDLPKIAGPIAEGIFSGKKTFEVEGKKLQVKVFTKSGLKYVDAEEFRFIEQNTKKSSKWAKMAREGAKIVWIFKHGSYYARVIDGKLTILGSKKS